MVIYLQMKILLASPEEENLWTNSQRFSFELLQQLRRYFSPCTHMRISLWFFSVDIWDILSMSSCMAVDRLNTGYISRSTTV